MDTRTIEDGSAHFDSSVFKQTLELAEEMVRVVKRESEWHRRMTHKHLSIAGKPVNIDDFKVGDDVYFYKPPTQDEAKNRTRKAKHLDHYVGPAKVINKIGTRSLEMQMTVNGVTREFQRDHSMVLHKKPTPQDPDPSIEPAPVRLPRLHEQGTVPEPGEFVILQDGITKSWYCAQVHQVLASHITVHYYTTTTAPLGNYASSTEAQRRRKLDECSFLRTWTDARGTATTIAPEPARRLKNIWSGRHHTDELDQQLLVRSVGLTANGHLDASTRNVTATLQLPHQQGAGGPADELQR